MNKIIFLGTDIHGKPNELATKTIKRLCPYFEKSILLSIQDIQKFSKNNKNKKTVIIPRISKIKLIRTIAIGILLPLYFLILRLFGYKKISMFWTADRKYHSFLFFFLRLIQYKIFFTIISGYDKKYFSLKYCDVIICQSNKMKKLIRKLFPNKEIKLIYPGVDLRIFKPKQKQNILLIPSVTHKINTLKYRSIPQIISLLKKHKIKSRIITREEIVAGYLIKQKIPNSTIINQTLSDKELSNQLSEVKIVPLIYKGIVPDMPLSAIEALSCGCAIICSDKMGLAEIIKENNCGLISNQIKLKDIKEIFNNPFYNKNARKTAEENFDIKGVIKQYKKLLA